MGMASCANIVTPTGGPRDEKPPVLKKVTPPDSSLNWQGGNLIFEFNEFIQLKDVAEQVHITPYIKPDLSVSRKKLILRLPDSLLEKNTTYHIQFGNAVRDINESNPISNLQHTFSTGSYFDSLQIKGQIYNARTGMPDTQVFVLLYPSQFTDTIVMSKQALYTLKSSDGSFVFKNLPDKSYRIFALRDVNKNGLYDHPDEEIGFLDAPIKANLQDDVFTLYTFKEATKIDNASATIAEKKLLKPTDDFTYKISIDTTQKNKRTFDVADSLKIEFSISPKTINKSSIRLFQHEVYDASASIVSTR
jgi:hypothetical protein